MKMHMKRLALLFSAIMVMALPAMAQKNGIAPDDEVICKKCKNSVVQNKSGVFMNVYDKGNKDHLTFYLGQDKAQAAASIKAIQNWYGNSCLRDYSEDYGHQAAPVTLYHGKKHCYLSHGNGEYVRRYVSRIEKNKENLLGRVNEKFLKKAFNALSE